MDKTKFVFTSPSGHQAEVPGSFGVPEEDIHCRCRIRTVVLRKNGKPFSAPVVRDKNGNKINYQEFVDNYNKEEAIKRNEGLSEISIFEPEDEITKTEKIIDNYDKQISDKYSSWRSKLKKEGVDMSKYPDKYSDLDMTEYMEFIKDSEVRDFVTRKRTAESTLRGLEAKAKKPVEEKSIVKTKSEQPVVTKEKPVVKPEQSVIKTGMEKSTSLDDISDELLAKPEDYKDWHKKRCTGFFWDNKTETWTKTCKFIKDNIKPHKLWNRGCVPNKWVDRLSYDSQERGLTEENINNLNKVVSSKLMDDSTRICIRSTPDSAVGIVKSGRIKTQFETGTSGGYIGGGTGIERNAVRADQELRMFGYKPDMNPTKRPIYGYVSGKEDNVEGAEAYGNVKFVLKPNTKKRATVTAGDSLNDNSQYFSPSRMDDFRTESIVWNSFGNKLNNAYTNPKTGKVLKPEEIERDFSEFSGNFPFIEAQIHDGVGTDDVEEVIYYDWDSDKRNDDQKAGELEQLCKNKGIKFRRFNRNNEEY